MNIAFTLDDLPLWPMSYPPLGYTAEGIVEKIISALAKHKIESVFAFANSWSIVKHPELNVIMDRWVSAGHHVANHTHSHSELNSMRMEDYIADIELGERHLQPWLTEAPTRYFRHPLCYWGDTRDKMEGVNSYLSATAYHTAEVTSWLYEWRWNRAYLNCLLDGNDKGVGFVRQSFLDFSMAQLHYDDESAHRWFGRRIPGITLGHTLPFFADIADELFGRLVDNGINFINLDEAAADSAYRAVASVPSGEFLVYQQKLAHAWGCPIPVIDPKWQETFDEITRMSAGHFERS